MGSLCVQRLGRGTVHTKRSGWVVWNLAVVGVVSVARPLAFWQALLWTLLPFVVIIPLGVVTAMANDWSKNG